MKTLFALTASLLLLGLRASALNWTPDGTRLLEVTGEYPNGREIFIINADGSDKRFLTANNLGHEYPTLSPDGKTILFTSYRTGKWKFYVMDPDGTNQRDLGMEPTSDLLNDPSRAEWSPDGKHFVFPLTKDGKRFLHIANADGTDVREIPDGRGLYPHWSRDGKALVFFAQGNIYSVNLDGTNRRQITKYDPDPSAPTRPNYPQWSLDGSAIYFLKGDDLRRINPDGTGETLIPTLPGMKWYLGMSVKGKLTFQFIENKRVHLYTVNPDGSELTRITK